ncbi:hypothetical protein BGX33_003706, partial [Mortierella sp. NVP41]
TMPQGRNGELPQVQAGPVCGFDDITDGHSQVQSHGPQLGSHGEPAHNGLAPDGSAQDEPAHGWLAPDGSAQDEPAHGWLAPDGSVQDCRIFAHGTYKI